METRVSKTGAEGTTSEASPQLVNPQTVCVFGPRRRVIGGRANRRETTTRLLPPPLCVLVSPADLTDSLSLSLINTLSNYQIVHLCVAIPLVAVSSCQPCQCLHQCQYVNNPQCLPSPSQCDIGSSGSEDNNGRGRGQVDKARPRPMCTVSLRCYYVNSVCSPRDCRYGQGCDSATLMEYNSWPRLH